jgi:hypothetical protein
MTELTAPELPQELAYRSNDGVEVALLWCRCHGALTVAVVDEKAGDRFELEIDAAHAMDAFHHPYAYAASRGVDYRAGAREVGETVYA